MSLTLEQLTAQVQANTDLEAGAITLLQELGSRIDAHKNEPAELAKLSQLLKGSAASLAAAIVANTSAADDESSTPPADPDTVSSAPAIDTSARSSSK